MRLEIDLYLADMEGLERLAKLSKRTVKEQGEYFVKKGIAHLAIKDYIKKLKI